MAALVPSPPLGRDLPCPRCGCAHRFLPCPCGCPAVDIAEADIEP